MCREPRDPRLADASGARGHDPCSELEHHALFIAHDWGRAISRVHARAGSYRRRARVSGPPAASARRPGERDGSRTRGGAGQHASAGAQPAERNDVARKSRRAPGHRQRDQGTFLDPGAGDAAACAGAQRHAAARPTLGFARTVGKAQRRACTRRARKRIRARDAHGSESGHRADGQRLTKRCPARCDVTSAPPRAKAPPCGADVKPQLRP